MTKRMLTILLRMIDFDARERDGIGANAASVTRSEHEQSVSGRGKDRHYRVSEWRKNGKQFDEDKQAQEIVHSECTEKKKMMIKQNESGVKMGNGYACRTQISKERNVHDEYAEKKVIQQKVVVQHFVNQCSVKR